MTTATQGSRPRLTIVVPCYNEADILPRTARRLLDLLTEMQDALHPDSRILCVDDGSRDATWDVIRQLRSADQRIAGISLAANSGHQNALVAGLQTALPASDFIVTIDADLQDDEGAIREMMRLAVEGCDIVYGVRSSRASDTWFKRTTAQTFYRLMSRLGVRTVYNHADFRLMSHRAVEALLRCEERNLFLRGLVPMLGYRTATVEYVRRPRLAGESKYPLARMLTLAFDGITSFSRSLLHLVLWTGILFLLAALGIALWVGICLVRHKAIAGWASLMLSVWFCSGCVLIALGIIGEYIGKIYIEVKHRPRYNIKDEIL